MSVNQVFATLVAGFAAGLINAVAGGGTLVSFPILLSIGLSPLDANITNTISSVLGHAGSAYSQRKFLNGFGGKIKTWIVSAGIGGILGSLLLRLLPEKVFENVVPILIFLACALLGSQTTLKRLIESKRARSRSTNRNVIIISAIFFSAIYGGYFGAGLGIILISILGLTLNEGITESNSLKAVLSFAVNISASLFFVFTGHVNWFSVGLMSISSLLGGLIGGKIAYRIHPKLLKYIVITFGIAVGLRMLA